MLALFYICLMKLLMSVVRFQVIRWTLVILRSRKEGTVINRRRKEAAPATAPCVRQLWMWKGGRARCATAGGGVAAAKAVRPGMMTP